MGQPLTTPFQNHLAKVSGSEMKIYLFLSLFISSFRSQKVSGSEICLLVNHRFLCNVICLENPAINRFANVHVT